MARLLVSGLTAAVAIVGCGDNARTCGDGTMELRGVCVPASVTACGDGTKLDNGQCVVDPEACQSGTVLIADRCVDPTRGLTVDLEEGAEPNALGIASGVEASATPAGVIALKPVGEAFVVHGHLTPFADADADGQLDPDFDTYVITVPGPTLVNVSVDGVGGAQGAFYATHAPAGPVVRYERYGLNLTGDTTKRRVFLPERGEYRLAITDTRSLAIGHNPPPPAGSGGAAGGPDAEYYASLTVEAIPTPTMIAVIAGTGTQTGTLATDEVKFFTAALGAGSAVVRDAMTGAATASVAVTDVDALRGYAEENPGAGLDPPTEARTTVVLPAAATPVFALDTVYNYGPAPEPFTLTLVIP